IDIAGPTQTLTTANEEGASPPYAVRVAAVSSGPIRTASGVKLIADPLPRAVSIDTLLVPAVLGFICFEKIAGPWPRCSALACARGASARSAPAPSHWLKLVCLTSAGLSPIGARARNWPRSSPKFASILSRSSYRPERYGRPQVSLPASI